VDDPVKRYLSKIGKRGGSVSSPAKAKAARANALKRWARERKKRKKARTT